MAGKKLVILAAVNGGGQQDREGARVPCTPAEIAEDAHACYQAGASVVHIHARGPDRQATGDSQVFGEIISRIREKCDILIQTTNGIGIRRDAQTGQMLFPSDEERLALLNIEPRQDLFSLAGGSWTFDHPQGGWTQGLTSFINTIDLLRRNIPPVIARGSSIEFEIVEISFMRILSKLADEGTFDRSSRNFWLDICMGFGGMPATPRTLVDAMEEAKRLFPQAPIEILATGHDQFPMNTIGVLQGADIVRVGFEDNIYLPNGQPARRNDQLVEAMARIGREFGREPASVREARDVFNLN